MDNTCGMVGKSGKSESECRQLADSWVYADDWQ